MSCHWQLSISVLNLRSLAFAGSLATHLSMAASHRMSLSQHLSKDVCGRDIGMLRCVLLTALDITKAVMFMHCSNFIHGDLKPHNILIADDPEVLPATHLHCYTAWLTWRFPMCNLHAGHACTHTFVVRQCPFSLQR